MNKSLLKRLAALGYIPYKEEAKGEKAPEEVSGRLALSFLSLGFQLDPKSVDILLSMSEEDLKSFYNEAFPALSELKGADLEHVIFYKNFPLNTDMSGAELYVRAILHYLTVTRDSQGFMSDDIRAIERLPYVSERKPEALTLVTYAEGIEMLRNFYTGMAEAPKAIPDAIHGEMQDFVREFPNASLTPQVIPFHRNIAIYAGIYMDGVDNEGDALVSLDLSFVKTITDVLRLYSVLSYSSPDLDKSVVFSSLSRKGRRILLAKLDEIALHNSSAMDDLAMHAELWKRAFEFLHPGEFNKKYPYIYRLATNLRNKNYVTFMSHVEACIRAADTEELLKHLCVKPGIFLRMLDSLLRNPELDQEAILASFSGIVGKVSTNVRISLWDYYKNREEGGYRSFIYRYAGSYRNFTEEDNRAPLAKEIQDKVIVLLEDSLRETFKSYPVKEKVYLSESMKDIMIPSNNTGASQGFHTLPMYSRMKLDTEGTDYLRFFTFWRNMKKEEKPETEDSWWSDDRVDIDLSLELFDQDLNQVKSLSWRTLMQGMKDGCVHSGDVTSAPHGASEFIDIDLKQVRTCARYAMIVNSCFTGQSFADIPDATSGVMFRKGLGNVGELFEPKDVAQCYKLTSTGCNMTIACCVDLETMELIWMDIPYHYGCGGGVAAEENLSAYLSKALNTHMSVYDLVKLHKGHITLTEEREEAEYVIDTDPKADMNPYNLPSLIGEWL